MDRRRTVAGRSFKEETDCNDEELVEGEDDEAVDEGYDVESLLNMRPADYGYSRSVSESALFTHAGGDESGSSSTGWVPVPQHRLPPLIPQPLLICQVDGCMTDMSNAKQYHKRHKVCQFHAKAQIAVVCGQQQRFCQQCSRFHLMSEFDESKRSCRRRLAGHNQRRRKSSFDHQEG